MSPTDPSSSSSSRKSNSSELDSIEDNEESSSVQPSNSKPWMQMVGLGMELASYTLGLAAIGYAIDRYRGHENGLGVAFGALIGFVFGMFRFIQKAMREIQNQYR